MIDLHHHEITSLTRKTFNFFTSSILFDCLRGIMDVESGCPFQYPLGNTDWRFSTRSSNINYFCSKSFRIMFGDTIGLGAKTMNF